MDDKRTKKRESNFELLRIMAMFGIIIYHLMLHHTDFTRFSFVDEQRFSSYVGLEIIQIFFTFGQISNTLFILITGYFLINKDNINIVKPGMKLLSRAYTVAIIVLIFSFLFNQFNLPIASHSDIHMLLNGWWFIGYYVFIIIFAKFFLNAYLKKMDQKSYRIFIFTLLILSNFMLVFNFLANLKIDTFVVGILVYSIGGYWRIYQPFSNVKLRTLLFICISFFSLLVIQYRVNLNNNVLDYQVAKISQPDLLTVSSPFANVLWSPSALFLIVSVVIFELFSRMRLGSIGIINKISASVFTVYLFHESHFFRRLRFQGLSLPNRLKMLTESIEQGGDPTIVTNQERWINLQEFLNISQVIREKGLKIGVLYIFILACSIFLMGVILEGMIIVINKVIKLLFSKEYEKISRIIK